jgi:hypothetical protein
MPRQDTRNGADLERNERTGETRIPGPAEFSAVTGEIFICLCIGAACRPLAALSRVVIPRDST